MGNKKIRVVHFFGKMDRGGAETFIMNLYKEINNEFKFDFIVSSKDKGNYDDEIRELGGEIFVVDSINKNPYYYIRDIMEILKKNNYDVIHSHVHHFSGINLMIGKLAGIKIRIAHSHNISDGKEDTNIRKLYRKLMLILIDKAATVQCACGEKAAKSLYENKLDDRCYIINNGIDIGKFMNSNMNTSALRNEFNIPQDAYVIGHIGRFQTQKNHKFLIDLFRKISERNEKAILVLVGEGELKAEIQNKVKNLNLEEKVRFLGLRSDIPKVMNLFDIFLFPSLYEGLGIVLIEAQACGLKCVTSSTTPKEVNITGNVEFVDLSEDFEKWYYQINNPKLKNTYYKKNLESYDIKNVKESVKKIYTTIK